MRSFGFGLCSSRGENLVKGMEHLLADLRRGQLSHTDADAFTLGENIAAGQVSSRSVVDGWMVSVGHCENIMHAEFQDLGVGYAHRSGSRYRHYWS